MRFLSLSVPPTEASALPKATPCRIIGERPFATEGSVAHLAFANDGSLWSLEETGVLRHWQVPTGKALEWHFLTGLATQWAIHPKCEIVASAADDVVLWCAKTGQRLRVLPQTSWVTALAFDREALFTGHDDGTIRLWDFCKGKLLHTYLGHGSAISALACSRSGFDLASASEDKTLCLWDLVAHCCRGRLTGHTDRVSALAWDSACARVFSAGWDTTVRVWDAESGEPVILLNAHADQVHALALSPKNDLLFTADSGPAVHCWDLAEYHHRHVLQPLSGEVHCLAFSQDGRQLAYAPAGAPIELFTPQRGRPLLPLRVQTESPVALSFAHDGLQFTTLHRDQTTSLRTWDVASGKQSRVETLSGTCCSIAQSPSTPLWALGGPDGRILLQAPEQASPDVCLTGPSVAQDVLTFAPGGTLLASASTKSTDVWLWNVLKAEPYLLIAEAVDGCTVEALAFHPEGKLLAAGGIDWLATGCSDGALAVWQIETRENLALLPVGVVCLAFSPTGDLLAYADLAQQVHLWELASQKTLCRLLGHTEPVHTLAFDPKGTQLATSGADRTLRLWEIPTGRPLAAYALDVQCKQLCYSPDGTALFCSNANGSYYQFELAKLLPG